MTDEPVGTQVNMGRTRKGSVEESVEELERLVDRYAGTPFEPRARFLLMLKREPKLKAEELVGELSLSDRTLRRWWSEYLTKGLLAFLDERVLQPLVAETPPAYVADDAEELLQFLNSLPVTSSYEEWKETVDRTLATYLQDIARVEVFVAGLDEGATDIGDNVTRSTTSRTLDLCIGPRSTLGRLRLHASPGCAFEPALQQLEELGPFIEFLYSDIAARMISRSSDESFGGVPMLTPGLAQSLTPRECDILVHRLSGYSYSDTAAMLEVSEETVRKCVKAIYRKTGTSTLGELFVRYFAASDTSAASQSY